MTDIASPRTDIPQDEPARQRDELDAAWRSPAGWRAISAVNQTYVGRRFVITGFIYFLIAGILGLVIRVQLAVPENDLLTPEAYNQIFTMHGTMMMFLFAVPILEGVAVYLLPPMLGARDLPFPRLSAFGYWCYLLGGLLLLSSLPLGLAPDSGWFIYPPLSSTLFSPGMNVDFWLLGITFMEISAITASIELIVAILKTRAPGMSIDRMPLFAWYILITAFMIVFGFPPLIMGSILLELERAFGLPFFDAAKGGHPLLWQHLFWLFGHPEVYIIFLPAAGIMSMVVPTFARHPIVGYRWLVLAAVGMGFLSFGLWVHHMFATGIPQLSLAFFSAASTLVAIPSGIQVFGWIATLWHGRPRFDTPLLFAIGTIVTFVIGGFTGVMVAIVPFDLQVHDTHFVVAHFHYVLIGGAVFPLFAGIHYWMPLALGRMPSERLGRCSFWTMFAGFHLTFFPLHWLGLIGMSRRVYTYLPGLNLELGNLIATGGAFLFALGVLLAMVNILWTARSGTPSGDNPWNAGTLEWLKVPTPACNFRSIPVISSRDPMWDQPKLSKAVELGVGFLPDSLGGRRLMMGTSATDARPEQVLELPGPTYMPLVAALCVGVFFVSFLLKLYAMAALGGLLSVAAFLVWMWPTSPEGRRGDIVASPGTVLPTAHGHHAAPGSTALNVTLAADAALYGSLAFSLFFLWSYTPDRMGTPLPSPSAWPAVLDLCLMLAGSAVLAWAERRMRAGAAVPAMLGLPVAMGLATAALAHGLLSSGHLGLPAQEHALAAVLWTLFGYQAIHAGAAVLIAGLAAVAAWRGHFTRGRHLALRIAVRFWHYTAALWAVGFVLVHIPPLLG
ncbi:cytochrome c oxidase subunit I [Azospirillum sp. SYSU D00513]|uniref:cytochrome c oxidase subunit I n=1 Tax=Azospirillum sp. SYSU D00513 TaxID=2812561 RepID=UPI001A95A206|nr:cytochrome c oxidase subunit I [Azospirillum sp. SYSU D00513]